MAKVNFKTILSPVMILSDRVLRNTSKAVNALREYRATIHKHKLVGVEENKDEEYEAIVQITNTKKFFLIKPEEILADDTLTDSFSQRDIRALTYLGYLGVNSPKYKVLAKRLCQEDKKFIFAVKEKGKKRVITKTAEELSGKEFLEGLDKKDAHMVGYAAGGEQEYSEEMEKAKLREVRRLKKTKGK